MNIQTLRSRFNLLASTALFLAGLPLAQAQTEVSLSSYSNTYGIYNDGTSFTTGGIDGDGYAYSAQLLGSSLSVSGTTFEFGTANQLNVVKGGSSVVVTLPTASYATLSFLGTGLNGNQASQTFTVTYSDNSTSTFTQSMSDWFTPQSYSGESTAIATSYRDTSSGGKDSRTFNLYAYSFTLTSSKTVKSLTLPNNGNVAVLAITLLPAAGGSCGGSPSGGPTDNAAATTLGSNNPAWTSNIKWCAVWNVKDYGAVADGTTDNTSAINSAVSAASTNGGVVYFPTGSYYVASNINTTNGVVFRGDAPSGSAYLGTLSPPSKLLFPKYVPSLSGTGTANSTAFRQIGTANGQSDSNIGVVNLDVNRAGIVFAESNPNTATNTDILVLGVRSNNVAIPDPGVPNSSQSAWQRFVYRFTYNINISGEANVLVANNQLNDLSKAGTDDSYSQPGYLFKNSSGTYVSIYSGSLAEFNYANHYGIQVNRTGTFVDPGSPTNDPYLFRNGILIRDNWVYKTMRVGIIASGQGLQVLHNLVLDTNGKSDALDATGTMQVGNSATQEDRVIDWSGASVTIDSNNGTVYQQNFYNGQTGVATGYASVDGEGILIQECCGGSLVSGVTITNNTLAGPNPYIGLYKVENIANATIENNTTSAYIYVSADTSSSYSATNVLINSNTVGSDINLYASAGGSGNQIENNKSVNGGNINYSTAASPTISGNTNFTLVPH